MESLSITCLPVVLSHGSLSIKHLWAYSKTQIYVQEDDASGTSDSAILGSSWLIVKQILRPKACEHEADQCLPMLYLQNVSPPKPVHRTVLPTSFRVQSVFSGHLSLLSASGFPPKEFPIIFQESPGSHSYYLPGPSHCHVVSTILPI